MSDDSESDEGAFGLILSLGNLPYERTTEHAFVQGFEAGQLWHRMTIGSETKIETVIRSSNLEVAKRMVAVNNWNIEAIPCGIDTEWTKIILAKDKPKAKKNPFGIRLVN